MNNGTLETLLDGFADLLAAKVLARLSSEPGPGKGTLRPRLLDVEQAAVYLGRTKVSVQHLISAGRLPVVRVDRRVFIDVRDLDTLIENCKFNVN